MRLDDLKKYGLPESLLTLWRSEQGDCLLPVQRQAVLKGLLEAPSETGRPGNMVISAPTSSGKSFCAELAAARVLCERRRVVMLFPLKSLAEEKYGRMVRTYGPAGIKCLLVTGDHAANDRAFWSGDFQMALAIYEKFDLALTARLDLLQSLGLIVIDEIQTLSDPGRGALLERLLTRLRASVYRPRLIALSAVLGGGNDLLVRWLDATLVEESRRPRDLWRGVAVDDRLRYRTFNDALDGEEALRTAQAASDNPVERLIAQIRHAPGQTLVFVKSRADAVALAQQLAPRLGYQPAEAAVNRLATEEASSLVKALNRVLQHGVAFHDSDLSADQRRTVEDAFRAGAVRVLCATTTLALGVNLPADNVFLETVKYRSGTYDGRPELTPITRAEFDNMTGRAGRLGSGDTETPGRAVVLADCAFDSEVLWENYIAAAPPTPLVSALETLPWEDWVLAMAACGLAPDRAALRRVYRQSYHAATTAALSDDDLGRRLNEAIELLTASGLFSGTDPFEITPAGLAAARTGLTVRQAAAYLARLQRGEIGESCFGWTCLALSTPDWDLPPSFLSWYEQAANGPVRMLYRRFDHSVEEALTFLPPEHRRQPLPYRAAAALKGALLLDEWTRLIPVEKLEARYGLHLGQIQALGRTAAHLVAALAALVRATDIESRAPALLAQHAFALRFGLPPEFEATHRLMGQVLNRRDFRRLQEAGLTTPEELQEQSAEERLKVIGDVDKNLKISELLDHIEEEVEMQSVAVRSVLPTGAQPQLVEIDGSFEGDRFLVRINGYPVKLTGKSFKYLTKLAWSRINRDAGWVYKEDIEVGFNQARYLYRMKNEINAAFRSEWPVVENNRLGYYRLQLDPARIRLNVDNLVQHPDYEVRSLFEAARSRSVN